MARAAALPEQPDDLDRLLEHLQAHVGLGPAVAEDVLVERLAAADAEREATVEQDDEVAAAWAITAGWMRIVGQVTAVVTCSARSRRRARRCTDHTNGLWPCSSTQGW